MLVGAAIIPAAPVLVPGLCPAPPAGFDEVSDAIDACIERMPSHDVVVLIGSARPGGVYDRARADLRPLGRPDVGTELPVAAELAEQITKRVGYSRFRGDHLPPSLAVLTLLVGGTRPVVPVGVPPEAGFDALEAAGIGIAEALLGGPLRVVAVASGDLSAGHDERAPLHVVNGARDWDDQVHDVVASGRLSGLQRLGPEEAARVGSLGWAALSVLHGIVARAKVGMVVRHYSAPRGVGYLVAHGA